MEGTRIVMRPTKSRPASADRAWTTVARGGSAPTEEIEIISSALPSPDLPWITIVWNDPINLMTYVTHVFMEVFGYAQPKAQKLMLDVHEKGRAVVSHGTRERMELDVNTLHGYGLWATLQQDD